MWTPNVYAKGEGLAEGRGLKTKIKYVEGHKHCNQITDPNRGFLLGSFGFEDGDVSCAGAFAIPILDTRNGHARLYYYKLGEKGKQLDSFNTTLDCLQEKGHSGCM